MEFFHRHFDQLAALKVGRREFLDIFGIHLRIRFISTMAVAGLLDLAARANPFPYRSRTLRGLLACERLERERRDLHMNVNAVKDRAGHLGLIFSDLSEGTAASFPTVAEMSAHATVQIQVTTKVRD